MFDRKGPQRPLAADEDEPDVGRAVDNLLIVIGVLALVAFIAAAGWWLTLEPGEHESGMHCLTLGRCDND